jgi:hypothetical protein
VDKLLGLGSFEPACEIFTHAAKSAIQSFIRLSSLRVYSERVLPRRQSHWKEHSLSNPIISQSISAIRLIGSRTLTLYLQNAAMCHHHAGLTPRRLTSIVARP